MRNSLRSVRARVERLNATLRGCDGEMSQAETDEMMVAILLEGRRRAAAGLTRTVSPEEARAKGRKLRARLVEAGLRRPGQ